MDGVDLALVALSADHIETRLTSTEAYPSALRARLDAAIAPDRATTVHEIATLDIAVGQHFAAAVNRLLDDNAVERDQILAIGSHGQTLRHHPYAPEPYSWQIGNAATIAALTGITTVADFRALDVAYGATGAPLVPPFHAWCFSTEHGEQVVLNLGGIANISLLDRNFGGPGSGYDTGPGNCLMDEWSMRHQQQPFDKDGAWAACGTVIPELLEAFMHDAYFSAPAPKSTGREAFNMAYISRHLEAAGIARSAAADVQSTLAQLTVESVAREIERSSTNRVAPVYVCGGGAHNLELMRRLALRLPARTIATTAAIGLAPDFVEAAAFAWLAQRRLAGRPITLTTSATLHRLCLGAIHEPRAHSTP